jgi:hypothetical protein
MTHSCKALVLLITFVASASTNAALLRPSPVFDAYGNISFKAERARLKNYAVQLRASPTNRGFVRVYAGGPWDAATATARARRAYNYLIKNERIDAKRLQWRYEGVCKQEVVLLYLLEPDRADPPRDPACQR